MSKMTNIKRNNFGNMSLWMKVFSILFIFQLTLINPIKAQVVLETQGTGSIRDRQYQFGLLRH